MFRCSVAGHILVADHFQSKRERLVITGKYQLERSDLATARQG